MNSTLINFLIYLKFVSLIGGITLVDYLFNLDYFYDYNCF